ncbi:MAG: hypothetical protein IPJ69_12835 [Deltaproteobacteria bacterium]|nr:MAG: hypothetical protein IPJ69_12835 [Deltaproteobacteria bacterium]
MVPTINTGVSLITYKPFGYTIPTTNEPNRNPSSTYALAGLALTSVVSGGCFKPSPVTNPHQAATISREECVSMNNSNNHTAAGTGLGVGFALGIFSLGIFKGVSRFIRWVRS